MRTFCWHCFREDLEMVEEEFRKASRTSPERATEITEIAIFWGVVIALALIVIGIIKGVFV